MSMWMSMRARYLTFMYLALHSHSSVLSLPPHSMVSHIFLVVRCWIIGLTIGCSSHGVLCLSLILVTRPPAVFRTSPT